MEPPVVGMDTNAVPVGSDMGLASDLSLCVSRRLFSGWIDLNSEQRFPGDKIRWIEPRGCTV